MPPTKAGGVRIPKGWKRLDGALYCRRCRQSSYVLRAVTIPVAGPVGESWGEFGKALRATWAETTRCANWMISQYYSRDVRRGPGDVRLAPMPHVSLYAEARALFPTLTSQIVGSLSQQVLGAYRAQRFALLWEGSRSLSSFRYPVAFPIPAQGWRLEQTDGSWHVLMRIGHRRWRLRLRGGPHMQRQLTRLQQLADGEAVPGTASVFPVVARAADRRGGVAAGGTASRVMVKLVGWFPKQPAAERSGLLRVRTGGGSLMAVEGSGWRVDPEPMRRVLMAEDRRRAALIANLHVVPIRGRSGIREALQDLSRKSRLRLEDACRTYAAALADHAERRHVGSVEYDDRDQRALPHFPWAFLRTVIASKLAERRIAFVHVNAAAAAVSSRFAALDEDVEIAGVDAPVSTGVAP